MRKFLGMLITVVLLVMVNSFVYAADSDYKGEATVLVADGGLADGSIKLNEKLVLKGNYEDRVFRAGLEYRISERIGVKAGVGYNIDREDQAGYWGMDLWVPFGNNLKITGFIDRNYLDKDWSRYETAFRIQMYPNHFIDAGVRNEYGDGAPVYDFNESGEPLFFLRGDFNWQWGKYSLQLKPLLYVQGYFEPHYTLKYNLNDRLDMVLKIDNIANQKIEYRAGIQCKF